MGFTDCTPGGAHLFLPGAGACGCGALTRPIVSVAEACLFQPAPINVDRLADLLDDNLPRMAYQRYGEYFNDDPDFDLLAYYHRVAEAIIEGLAEVAK